MAGKKSSRSSKTDHVLSLLSAGTREEPHPVSGGGAEQEAQPQPGPAAVPVQGEEPSQGTQLPHAPAIREGERLVTPILQVARTNNEALSQTIRDALSQALEEEEEQWKKSAPLSEPEAEPCPVQEEGQAQEAGNVESDWGPEEDGTTGDLEEGEAQQSAPMEEAEQEEQNGAVPADQETSTQPPQPQEPQVPFAPRETKLPDGCVCVNVMELLVDERLERYVRMFGLCTCPRCLADARALALTRLPSKYVVLSASAATPMLSLYRAKFESLVIAQVIQACKTVMESPRHQE